MLTVSNLDKKFGHVHAVDKLSFTINKGNIYGLLGPNGSGKSTTLGIILNVVNKTDGDFKWFDGSITVQDALKRVGAIIERPNFYPNMSAYENLRLVCKIKDISTDKIHEKLKQVNLFERRDSKFKTFSLGMKQRLAIASALLNDPQFLILDEPTNGLDPQGIHEIREIIKDIANSGATILLASHLLDEVEKICSHVIVIRQGKKLYEGKVDELTQSYGFIEVKADIDNVFFQEILQQIDGVSKIEQNKDMFTLFLDKNLSTSQINKYCFDNGIVLTHLLKRKPSLEKQFLSLTSNTNS
ncbi:MAG TPA: ATP-binding cassette domain-containing protein [Flavobacteriia bacterium]|nr:ATP-binding cassette domain-containing protein [Flavobacteriia bacterium]